MKIILMAMFILIASANVWDPSVDVGGNRGNGAGIKDLGRFTWYNLVYWVIGLILITCWCYATCCFGKREAPMDYNKLYLNKK